MIPYGRQEITKKDILEVEKVLRSDFLTQGPVVPKFEQAVLKYCGAKYAVATTNGTSALHISLILAGVEQDDEVITQPLNFVASCNAISYCKARPIFIDVDIDTMGLSPKALRSFLKNNTKIKDKKCINKKTNKVIRACVPMHSYGHPCRIDEIKKIKKKPRRKKRLLK